MNQVRHILSKDLRRLRWSVIGWCALVGARTLVDTAGADIALGGFGLEFGIGELSALLSLMYALFLALLVSRLVHDEPLVGLDAFWITRPIASGALMRAKLVFAALLLLVVPLGGSVIVAAAFGTDAAGIARTVPVFALNQCILVVVLMALAAVTPSLTRYILAMLGVVAGFVVLMASAVIVTLLTVDEIPEGGDITIPDPTPTVVGGTLILFTALAVIIYQYRTRRLGRALAIAGIGAAICFVVPERWTWSLAAQPLAEMAAAPQDTTALTVSLDGGRPRVVNEFSFGRRRLARKQIAAHAIVTGVPPEFNVRSIVSRSRLDLPGDVVLQTGGDSSNATLGVVSGSTSGRGVSVEAALGGIRLLTRSDMMDALSSEQWPALLNVSEADFMRYRGVAGRLATTLDLLLERPIARGALPLADGATADIGATHVSIVRVIRHATGCTVLVRRSYVESLFSRRQYRDFMYVLNNTARREAAGSSVRPVAQQEGFSAGGFYLSVPHVGGRGFVLEQYEIQFPGEARPDGPSVDLDEAWLAGSELVVLEMVAAGRISRPLTIDGFRMVP